MAIDPATAIAGISTLSGLFGGGGGGGGQRPLRPEQAPQFEEMLKIIIPMLTNQAREMAELDPVRSAALFNLVRNLQSDNRQAALKTFLTQAVANAQEQARIAGAAPGVSSGEREAMNWDAKNKGLQETNQLSREMASPEWDAKRLQEIINTITQNQMPGLRVGQDLQRSSSATMQGGVGGGSSGWGEALGAIAGLIPTETLNRIFTIPSGRPSGVVQGPDGPVSMAQPVSMGAQTAPQLGASSPPQSQPSNIADPSNLAKILGAFTR